MFSAQTPGIVIGSSYKPERGTEGKIDEIRYVFCVSFSFREILFHATMILCGATLA